MNDTTKRITLPVTITSLAVNVPFFILIWKHWPIDENFLLLLGHAPGQYLFLFLFFPVISFFIFLSGARLRTFIIQNVQQRSLWNYLFFGRRWLVSLIGLFIAILLGKADYSTTMHDIDYLRVPQAKSAAKASDIILRNIAESTPTQIAKELSKQLNITSTLHYYNDFTIPNADMENILAFVKEKEESVESRNRLLIQRVAKKMHEAVTSGDIPSDNFIESISIKQLKDSKEGLLNAITYLQIVLDRQLNNKWLFMPFVITNLIELIIVIFVCWHMLCWAISCIALRLTQFREAAPYDLRRAGLPLVFATVILSFWPPLRIYTIRELEMVFSAPQDIGGPVLVYFFIFSIAAFLIVAFAKKQVLEIVSAVIPMLGSFFSLVMSLRHVFFIRNYFGASAPIGTLIAWIIPLSLFLAILILIVSLKESTTNKREN